MSTHTEPSAMPSHQVKSAFTFDDWQESPDERWEGGRLSRTTATKRYTGEIEGTGSLEAIMLRLGGDEGPAVYVAVEKLDVQVGERSGTFYLVHTATANEGVHDKTLKVVPGSGTGDFSGIAGVGEILEGHDFVLEYDLEG